MSKRCELQKEYYQQYGNYKGNGKYCDKYVSWLENEVLALRQPLVSGRSEQLNCDHLWKSRFNQKRGSYVICSKCSEER